MGWVCCTHKVDKNAFKIKRRLRIPKHRWKDDNKTDIREKRTGVKCGLL
jgi:hypothetical protein